MPRYPHLLLVETGTAEPYTATRSRAREFLLPQRDRPTHAAHLIGAFQQAQAQRENFPQQIGNGFYESPGLTLTFESEPNFPLAFESLDLQASKIQLLSVKTDAGSRECGLARTAGPRGMAAGRWLVQLDGPNRHNQPVSSRIGREGSQWTPTQLLHRHIILPLEECFG